MKIVSLVAEAGGNAAYPLILRSLRRKRVSSTSRPAAWKWLCLRVSVSQRPSSDVAPRCLHSARTSASRPFSSMQPARTPQPGESGRRSAPPGPSTTPPDVLVRGSAAAIGLREGRCNHHCQSTASSAISSSQAMSAHYAMESFLLHASDGGKMLQRSQCDMAYAEQFLQSMQR